MRTENALLGHSTALAKGRFKVWHRSGSVPGGTLYESTDEGSNRSRIPLYILVLRSGVVTFLIFLSDPSSLSPLTAPYMCG